MSRGPAAAAAGDESRQVRGRASSARVPREIPRFGPGTGSLPKTGILSTGLGKKTRLAPTREPREQPGSRCDPALTGPHPALQAGPPLVAEARRAASPGSRHARPAPARTDGAPGSPGGTVSAVSLHAFPSQHPPEPLSMAEHVDVETGQAADGLRLALTARVPGAPWTAARASRLHLPDPSDTAGGHLRRTSPGTDR